MNYKLNQRYPVKIYNEVKIDIDTMQETYANFIEYWGPMSMCAAAAPYIFKVLVVVIAALITYQNMPSAHDIGPVSEQSTGNEVNTRSTQEPLGVIYGTVMVTGNDVFGGSGGNQSKDLYIVQTLGEGEIDSIYQEEGVDQVFVNDEIYTEFGTDVEYTFYSGSSTQTYDTDINAFDSNWTDNLRYTAYIAWHFTWNENNLKGGIPKRQIIVKGRKLYDFRDSTTAYSDNGCLAAYDWFTNTRYGMGVDSSKINTDSWTVVADYIDAKGWKFNRVIRGNEMNPWDALQMILRHIRASLQWFDGQYYLYVSDLNEESSVFTIEDRHIAVDGNGEALLNVIQPSRFNTPKGLRITYNDASLGYVKNDIVFGEVDGIINSMNLLGCTSRDELGEHAFYELERQQLNRIITGTFSDECLELEPHDLITFNSTSLNISDQLMRVVSVNLHANGLSNLTLQYESEDLYDYTYNLDVDEVYTCSLPNPRTPTNISNPSISEELYYYRLRYESRLLIDFDVPETEPWFDHVEVWQYITSGASPSATSFYKHQFNTTNNFIVDKVEEGMTYYFLLRPVSIYNVKTDLDSSVAIAHYVEGKSSAPPSLSYLSSISTYYGVNIFSDKLDFPDIECYQLRLGSQWNGGAFMSNLRSPQWFLNNVKPGLHYFTANTLGTNGIYGNTPVYTSINVVGETPVGTFTDDYITDPGVFNNTEHTLFAGDDYLKCSHSGSTSGSYISNEFDFGSIDSYTVWVDADIALTGDGTTWNDVFSSAASASTWEDINASTRSWNDIFEVSEAGFVNMKILYSNTSGGPYSEMDKAEICMGIVEGRYFKVRITIIDPSEAVFMNIENFTLNYF